MQPEKFTPVKLSGVYCVFPLVLLPFLLKSIDSFTPNRSGTAPTQQVSPHGKLLTCGHNSSIDDVIEF